MAKKKNQVKPAHGGRHARLPGRDVQPREFRLPLAIPTVTGGASSAMDFATALQQGHPNAVRIAQEAMKDQKKVSLADLFVAETYTLPKRLGLDAHHAKKVEPILMSYRQDLMRARKFEIDLDFVRYVTEMSTTMNPQKMLTRLQYATLPYDITWIEFDLKTKVEVMRRLHNKSNDGFDWDDVADRLGLIMKRLSPTRMQVEMVCETHGDYGLIGTTICYFFSLDEYDFTMKDGKDGCRPFIVPEAVRDLILSRKVDEKVQRRVSDGALLQIGSGSLWGFTASGGGMMIERANQMRDIVLPAHLARHGCLGSGRMREIMMCLINQERPSYTDRAVHEVVSQLMVNETTEFTGMMRWVVCVLACLNEVPIDTQHVVPQGKQRVGLTNHRRLFDYHRVTLRVPKEHPLRFMERKFRQATRRRAHDVMAHWRTYTYDDNCKDEHEWQYDYDEGFAVCGKCVAYRRFIKEHVRGDETLGWVSKSYVVKQSRQP